MWPDREFFESSWLQILLQKYPKYLTTFPISPPQIGYTKFVCKLGVHNNEIKIMLAAQIQMLFFSKILAIVAKDKLDLTEIAKIKLK